MNEGEDEVKEEYVKDENGDLKHEEDWVTHASI